MVSVKPCNKFDCPSEEALNVLLADGTAAGSHPGTAEHVGSCLGCQQRLESLAVGPEAELAAVVRNMGEAEPPANSAYWKALGRAEAALSDSSVTQGFGTDGNDGGSPPDVNLNFLSPAAEAGYLGRISAFDVKRVIGRGGMGIVFQGFDSSLHRDVAIKVLDPQLASNDVARQRFCREARAAAAVSHDNLVTVFQVDEDVKSGLPFIVMQLVTGESLEQRLRRVGKMAVVDVVRVGMQCAAGLASSHATGLIHRDIKPGNILLEAGSDKAKLTDFGLARAAEDLKLTRTGFVAGTPLYMAPEQARGDDIDARADLFSLGSVLYEALAGRPPFEGRTPLAVLRRVADEAHTPLHMLNPDVPEWLEDAIDQLLAKYPADRFQTAAELATFLEGHYALIKGLTPTQVPATACSGPRSALRMTRGQKKFCVRTASTLASVFGVGVITGSVAAWLLASHVYDSPDRQPLPPLAVAAMSPDAVTPKPDDGPDSVTTFPSKSGSVWALGVSPDGKTLATGIESGRVTVWDAETKRLRFDLHPDKDDKLSAHTGPVWAVEFSPDGSTLATVADDGQFKSWDLKNNGKLLKSFGMTGSIRTAAVGPKGQRVAVGDRQGTVFLFDMEREESIFSHAMGTTVTTVAFSPDGSMLAAAGGDGSVVIFEVSAAGAQKRIGWQASESPVYSVAFSPDGAELVTAGWDQQATVWNVNTRTRVGEPLKHPEGVWVARFSPCGKVVATAGQDGKTRLFDLDDGWPARPDLRPAQGAGALAAVRQRGGQRGHRRPRRRRALLANADAGEEVAVLLARRASEGRRVED